MKNPRKHVVEGWARAEGDKLISGSTTVSVWPSRRWIVSDYGLWLATTKGSRIVRVRQTTEIIEPKRMRK